jgi:hypothetical protein
MNMGFWQESLPQAKKKSQANSLEHTIKSSITPDHCFQFKCQKHMPEQNSSQVDIKKITI